MNEPRPAATVILLRDAPAFEMLMIERHEDIAFAGGALVFPGGAVGEGDAAPDWRVHCDGYEALHPDMRAPAIAAIREAFEETGLLLARGSDEEIIDDDVVETIASWRKIVSQDDAQFMAMVRQAGLRLALDALTPFAHWVAPPDLPRQRYDTRFFAAKAPPDQTPREDGNEATEAIWISPGAALRDKDAGKRKMIFPTLRNVELVNLSGGTENLLTDARARKITPIQPRVIEQGGRHFITIPEGHGYPVTREALETARRF